MQCGARDEDPGVLRQIQMMVQGAPLRPKEAAVLLHWAAQLGNVNVMRAVLAPFPTCCNCPCPGAGGRTALHIAAAAGHLHAVKFLVTKAGVDLTLQDDNGDLAVSVTKKYSISV